MKHGTRTGTLDKSLRIVICMLKQVSVGPYRASLCWISTGYMLADQLSEVMLPEAVIAEMRSEKYPPSPTPRTSKSVRRGLLLHLIRGDLHPVRRTN